MRRCPLGDLDLYDPSTAAPAPVRRSLAAQALTRPYPVTPAMVLLVSLVPFYIFIAEMMPGRTLHRPEVAMDRALPLQPAWALVYGSLYLFLILLPVFVVRQQEQVRRTVLAYLMIWITAYVCFSVYPTQAPRPAEVARQGFVAGRSAPRSWGSPRSSPSSTTCSTCWPESFWPASRMPCSCVRGLARRAPTSTAWRRSSRWVSWASSVSRSSAPGWCFP